MSFVCIWIPQDGPVCVMNDCNGNPRDIDQYHYNSLSVTHSSCNCIHSHDHVSIFTVSYRNVSSLPCNRIMKCYLSFGHRLEKQTRWQERSCCPLAALFASELFSAKLIRIRRVMTRAEKWRESMAGSVVFF